MFSTSAIEISRNWSGLINRFCFGFLTLYMLKLTTKSGTFFALEEASSFDLRTLAILIGIIVLSLLLGAIVITAGSFVLRPSVSEKQRLERAYKVGQTNNSLLIEALRDAHTKYDIAAGFNGLILAFAVIVTSRLMLDGSINWNQDVVIKERLPLWKGGAFGFLAYVFSSLVNFSAMRSIRAIDAVLSGVEKKDD